MKHLNAVFVTSVICIFFVSCRSDSNSGGGKSGAEPGSGTSYEPDSYDYTIEGAVYYVDSENGSDENAGTKDAPFATILHALSVVKGGDGIYVNGGEYGDLSFGANFSETKENYSTPIEEVFDDWVTVKAVEGTSPELDRVRLGTWHDDGGWFTIDFSQLGNSDLRLRLDGFTVNNGVMIYGSRHVDVRNCLIKLDGTFSELSDEEKTEFMATPGVGVYNGRYVTVLNNEITNTGLGVSGMTTDFVIKDNHIHHCFHDGIQIHGGTNWLIEGNTVHDLDDGVGDDDGASYNMHVDGIHMYMINSAEKWAHGSYNFTIRGNFIYHTEAMGVMINSTSIEGGGYENFVWENNIFGPSDGTLFIMGAVFENGNVFRHNTILYTPNDQWTSHLGRTFGEDFGDPRSSNYYVQTWSAEGKENHEFYNNILTSVTSFTQGDGFVEMNIYYTENSDAELENNGGFQTSTLPYEPIDGGIQDVIDAGNVPGVLTENSIAVDSGASSDSTAYELTVDFLQNARDDKPDVGAIEY